MECLVNQSTWSRGRKQAELQVYGYESVKVSSTVEKIQSEIDDQGPWKLLGEC